MNESIDLFSYQHFMKLSLDIYKHYVIFYFSGAQHVRLEKKGGTAGDNQLTLSSGPIDRTVNFIQM